MNQFKLLKYNAFLVAATLCLAVLVPMVSVFSSWSVEKGDVWAHLISTSLLDYSLNTIFLVLGVSFLSLILGVSLAVFTVFYEFPGRKLFSLLGFAPLVFPPYVMGFVLLGIFEQSGPVAIYFSRHLNIPLSDIPQFGGLFGSVVSLSVSLFPYVYMMTRISLEQQSQRILEAGRSLGLSSHQAIIKLAIPLAKPWIISGTLIVCMEVMADFGTVSVFSFDTFTTGIFKAWYGFFDFTAACQLASILLLAVNILYVLKIKSEGAELKYQNSVSVPTKRINLKASLYSIPVLFFSMFFSIFVIIPILQLTDWSLGSGVTSAFDLIYKNLFNTLLISAITGAVIILCSVLVFTAKRIYYRGRLYFSGLASVPNLGYAFPGAVLAVGLVVPFNLLDAKLIDSGLLENAFFSGSISILILGLTIRFYAVGSSAVVGGLNRIPRNTDEASVGLGRSGFSLFRRVLLPNLRSPMLYGFIFCVIDIAKELPLTLMARPMGWDTLAVKIYEWTSEGEWEKAALPSLILVCFGVVSLWLMIRSEKDRMQG